MYVALKNAHILFVTVSIVLFEYRFFIKFLNKPINRTLKIVPHINDTFLLVSGISLAVIASFNPLQQVWLGSKIIALLLYIGFGFLALKSKGTKSIVSFILATATYLFMVFTAITKTPLFMGL